VPWQALGRACRDRRAEWVHLAFGPGTIHHMEHEPPKVNDPKPDNVPDPLEHPYAEGVNHLLTGLANIVDDDKVLQAVGNWINAHADDVKKRSFSFWRNFATSLSFSLLIYVGIFVLAWNGKISKESTVTLLGMLIGYLYGKTQGGKEK
jgi:hypothetical protein